MSKNVYETPTLIFSSTGVSDFNANCTKTDDVNATENTCKMTVEGIKNVFSTAGESSPCEVDIESFGSQKKDKDGYCYHIPTSDMQYFSS